MALSLVSEAWTGATAQVTQSIDTGAVGDIVVVSIGYNTTTVHATGITDTGSKFSWQSSAVTSSVGTGNSHGAETWYGIRTSTGATTLTVAFSGSVSSVWVEIGAVQIRSGSFGSGTAWTVKGNFLASTTNFPSITSYASGAEQGYVGGQVDIGTAAAGSTSGFTYYTHSGNVLTQNLALGTNTAYSPNFTTSSGAACTGVIVSASASGSESSTVYSSSVADLGGGTGSWASTGNANGAPDASSAVWTSA